MDKPTALEKSAMKQTSSAGRWWGYSVIYGKEDDHATPYMTRVWLGRLRIHAFHRGDQDPDCHDHPWDFWTFPLQPYVEEVAIPNGGRIVSTEVDVEGERLLHEHWETDYFIHRQVVPAWRWTFRPAEHCHRVVGLHDGVWPALASDLKTKPGTILTFVWRGRSRRTWGFLKERAGRWCRVFWKDYVYGGGKSAPCE